MNASSYLRPMDLRDILDETFDLYKDNFALFFSITATVFLPFQLLMGALGGSGLAYPKEDPTAAMHAILSRSSMLFPWLFVYYLTIGALTAAISDRCLGRTSSLREAYRSISGRFLPFILTLFQSMLMMGLGIFVLIMLIVAVTFALAGAGTIGGFLIVLFLLAAVVGGAIYGFLFAFVVPVFVMEGKTGGAAIRRSRELILFNLKKIIGAITLIGILTVLITSILAIPVALLFGAFEAAGQTSHLSGLFGGAINGFIQALAQPIQLIVIVLLYYDVRIRREGFDLEMMANELREASPIPDGALSPDGRASAAPSFETAAPAPEGRESPEHPVEPNAGEESAREFNLGERIAAPEEAGSESEPDETAKPETST